MKTLYDVLTSCIERYNQKTALIDYHTGKEYSYKTLSKQIQSVTKKLSTICGVQPGDRVGLLLLNQVEFVVSFFALQALGAIVVPLNYRLTAEELYNVAKHSDMKGLISCEEEFDASYQMVIDQISWLVLTDEDKNDELEVTDTEIDEQDEAIDTEDLCPVHYISDWLEDGKASDSDFTLPELSRHEVAVLIYTSGTTGDPKGVMLSHQNLLEDVKANVIAIEASRNDVFVTCSPLFHVFGLTNIMLTALFQGAKIVLVKRFNPRRILEAITRYRVTFLAAVPTMYQMMLALLPNPVYEFSSLRVCHSGAAPMPQTVFYEIEKLFSAPVQEGYGQSEASSIVTSNPLRGLRKPGSIGLPLHGITVEIVDEQDNELPPNEVGELRVQGETVMVGYWMNPVASWKAVRSDWLYTSDMGYYDEDGFIYLVGRKDDMINVGGAKVYPREVEEVLYQYPDIASCAVTAEASDLYHQIVVAYIVVRAEEQPEVVEIQKFCREHLAEYKVPKTIYFVDEIPQGPTGKILRHHLKPSCIES
jgi:long-chain acyl-CoA synthetase